MKTGLLGKTTVAAILGLAWTAGQARAAGDSVEIIRQSLLGAGVGAISAGASGGKAGKGALIGAGTQVIGTALIGLLTGPSASRPSYAQQTYSQPVYAQPAYVYQPQPQIQVQPAQVQPVYSQPVYTTTYRYEPVQVSTAPVYAAPAYREPAGESNRRILRQGLLGAGVGAISAEVSGGKAGTGALAGAGSNVIGGALLELLSS